MPKSEVTVTAVFAPKGNTEFDDVAADDYYYDAVKWAAEKGIANGVGNGLFDPNAVCTRAQIVTFLWRAAGSPVPKSSTMPFTDVPAGSYYYNAVLWAVENGITEGTTATTFDPDANCSRGQIVTFLWRAEKSPAAAGKTPFTDVASKAYFADAITWAVNEGITEGKTATTFNPDDNCARGQIVTFIWRCMQ